MIDYLLGCSLWCTSCLKLRGIVTQKLDRATLSPDIKMHILLTVLHTFLMELVRRICLKIFQ